MKPTLSSITDTISNENISESVGYKSDATTSYGIKMILISFILAILGVNVLLYLFEGTDIITKYMSGGVISIVKSLQRMVRYGVRNASNTVHKSSGLHFYKENKHLNNDINKPKNNVDNQRNNNKSASSPHPDMTTESPVQNPKNTEWCYIGKDRTYRSCVRMQRGDSCMSGEIFPTKNICINPNLRHNV